MADKRPIHYRNNGVGLYISHSSIGEQKIVLTGDTRSISTLHLWQKNFADVCAIILSAIFAFAFVCLRTSSNARCAFSLIIPMAMWISLDSDLFQLRCTPSACA